MLKFKGGLAKPPLKLGHAVSQKSMARDLVFVLSFASKYCRHPQPCCGAGTGEFPAQRASNAENVSIWWRHHVIHMTHLQRKSTVWHADTLAWVELTPWPQMGFWKHVIDGVNLKRKIAVMTNTFSNCRFSYMYIHATKPSEDTHFVGVYKIWTCDGIKIYFYHPWGQISSLSMNLKIIAMNLVINRSVPSHFLNQSWLTITQTSRNRIQRTTNWLSLTKLYLKLLFVISLPFCTPKRILNLEYLILNPELLTFGCFFLSLDLSFPVSVFGGCFCDLCSQLLAIHDLCHDLCLGRFRHAAAAATAHRHTSTAGHHAKIIIHRRLCNKRYRWSFCYMFFKHIIVTSHERTTQIIGNSAVYSSICIGWL